MGATRPLPSHVTTNVASSLKHHSEIIDLSGPMEKKKRNTPATDSSEAESITPCIELPKKPSNNAKKQTFQLEQVHEFLFDRNNFIAANDLDMDLNEEETDDDGDDDDCDADNKSESDVSDSDYLASTICSTIGVNNRNAEFQQRFDEFYRSIKHKFDTGDSLNDGSILPVFNSLKDQLDFFNERFRKGQCKGDFVVFSGRLFCSTCIEFDSVRHLAPSAKSIFGKDDMSFICDGLRESIRKVNDLHKKLNKHKDSIRHQCCVEVKQMKAERRLPELLALMEKKENNLSNRAQITTQRLFNIAYHVAKNSLPFSEYTRSIELQEKNSVYLGTMLRSDKAGKKICSFISSMMKNGLVNAITRKNFDLSIAADESSSVKTTTMLTIDIKVVVEEIPIYFFWDLVELEKANGASIARAIMESLEKKNCFSRQYLKKHLIGLGADGASAMQGKISGAAAELLVFYPNLVANHCLAHRYLKLNIFCIHHLKYFFYLSTELGVGETVQSLPEFQDFAKVSNKLYAYYHRSPKRSAELKGVAASLGAKLLSVKHIFDVRWAMSSRIAVLSLINNLEPLVIHLQADHKALTSKISSMKKGTESYSCVKEDIARLNFLLAKLQEFVFLARLALIADCLEIVSALSLKLQCRELETHEIWYEVTTTTHSIGCLASEVDGCKLKDFFNQISAHKMYHGIHLEPTDEDYKTFAVIREEFCDKLKDNLNTRFAKSSNVLMWASVLDKRHFPTNADDKDIEIHGRTCQEIYWLARRFGFDVEKGEDKLLIAEFIDLIKSNRKGPLMSRLFRKLNTLIFATAECERDFSVINSTWNKSRSSLLCSTVSSLLFLKLNGPSETHFQPARFVQAWLRTKHCSAVQQDRRFMKKKKESQYKTKTGAIKRKYFS